MDAIYWMPRALHLDSVGLRALSKCRRGDHLQTARLTLMSTGYPHMPMPSPPPRPPGASALLAPSGRPYYCLPKCKRRYDGGPLSSDAYGEQGVYEGGGICMTPGPTLVHYGILPERGLLRPLSHRRVLCHARFGPRCSYMAHCLSLPRRPPLLDHGYPHGGFRWRQATSFVLHAWWLGTFRAPSQRPLSNITGFLLPSFTPTSSSPACTTCTQSAPGAQHAPLPRHALR